MYFAFRRYFYRRFIVHFSHGGLPCLGNPNGRSSGERRSDIESLREGFNMQLFLIVFNSWLNLFIVILGYFGQFLTYQVHCIRLIRLIREIIVRMQWDKNRKVFIVICLIWLICEPKSVHCNLFNPFNLWTEKCSL